MLRKMTMVTMTRGRGTGKTVTTAVTRDNNCDQKVEEKGEGRW
jgi:hypothetical protein